jgi:hypothetical protein
MNYTIFTVQLCMFIFQYNIINVTYLQVDEAVVKAVVSVLTAEEEALGQQQPRRIGQRPLPMTIRHNQTDEGYLMP